MTLLTHLLYAHIVTHYLFLLLSILQALQKFDSSKSLLTVTNLQVKKKKKSERAKNVMLDINIYFSTISKRLFGSENILLLVKTSK